MTREQMSLEMDYVFEQCRKMRAAGQKEYAHAEDNAFANFERVAERTNLDRKVVLLVYGEKHIDGIHSYVQGHKSQREDVTGRIYDLIVYMCLLHGMIREETAIPLRPGDAETTQQLLSNIAITDHQRGHPNA